MKKSEATRHEILEKAFQLIYENGYLSTSIEDILTNTHVTKGAFYYHFKNKDEMGVAIIHEILKPVMVQGFIQPLESNEDPVEFIYQMMEDLLLHNKFLSVEHGCPVGNLTQEMTPWNSEFSKALEDLIAQWKKTLKKSIERGKKMGFVRSDVSSEQVTYFVISGYWGIRSFGKLYNSKSAYMPYLKELRAYLNNLK